MRRHQNDPVRRLVKIILRQVRKRWRQKKTQKKTGKIITTRREKVGHTTKSKPRYRSTKWGQVTGFATGKLQKYLQQSFRILEFI